MTSRDNGTRSWGIAGGFLLVGGSLSGCSAGSESDEAGSGGPRSSSPTSAARDDDGAASTLTDCRETGGAGRASSKCAPPLCETAGSIGPGPRIGCAAFDTKSSRGFIDTENRRLVVSVSSAATGGIWGIGLDDGSRELLSGSAADAERGTRSEGEGVELVGVDNVQRFTGGWIAHAEGRLVAIDPVDASRRSLLEGNSRLCAGSSEPFYVELGRFTIHEDGSFYFPARRGNTNEGALVRMPPDLASCRVVAHWDSFEGTILGNGPFNMDVPLALLTRGDQLWWVDQASLIALDLDTSSWRRVSSASSSRRVGAGDAEVGGLGLAWGDARVWTLGNEGITSVDPSNGARAGYTFEAGPVYNGSVTAFWPVPSSELLLLGVGGAFVLYDPSTNNSNLFSW